MAPNIACGAGSEQRPASQNENPVGLVHGLGACACDLEPGTGCNFPNCRAAEEPPAGSIDVTNLTQTRRHYWDPRTGRTYIGADVLL